MTLKSVVCIALWLGTFAPALGQGKLVLIGGGSESEGGWSDAPYAWAVHNSDNKRVAVVSYSDADNFIPDYFVALGAVAADNIKIATRSEADRQETYDSLMRYDVLFLKGGDQAVYYQEYKGTKTEQALIDKFNAGGVVAGTSAGMAVLSDVIYTAENGSVYPDQALQNVLHNRITLADDFLGLLPGFIVDSHFTERGRVGRLIPFMANWFIQTGELIKGIGVDDRTALCIATDRTAEVFGTGSVSVYSANFLSAENGKPIAEEVSTMQLLHGHSVDLNALEILDGPEDVQVHPLADEQGSYEVLLSGGEGYASNTAFLDHLVLSSGNKDDSIVVVTAVGRAKPFIQRLESLGANVTLIETTSAANSDDRIELRNAIRSARKILFVENRDNTLFNFLKGGPTGELLRNHLHRNGVISAFVGDNSRYAGKVWVVNHLTDRLAAYYGRLEFHEGLGLLASSVIMPNTYDANDADFYENTTASVSWAMVNEYLKYGIYLNRDSFLKFYQEDGENYLKAFGDFSALLLIHDGGGTAKASQVVNTGGATRNYVGFRSFQYALLSGSQSVHVGTAMPSSDAPYEFEEAVVGVEKEIDRLSVNLMPNPSESGIFLLTWNVSASRTFVVMDMVGRKLAAGQCPEEGDCLVDLSAQPRGVYVIKVRSGNQVRTVRGLKQ